MEQEEITVFWEKAFREEAANSFNKDEMNNVISFVKDISKKGSIDLESQYKNFYNILIVLKVHSENNKSLHDNFIDHLQKRYVDHWDWANKYQKEDDDMHYYGLYCKCRNKIGFSSAIASYENINFAKVYIAFVYRFKTRYSDFT